MFMIIKLYAIVEGTLERFTGLFGSSEGFMSMKKS